MPYGYLRRYQGRRAARGPARGISREGAARLQNQPARRRWRRRHGRRRVFAERGRDHRARALSGALAVAPHSAVVPDKRAPARSVVGARADPGPIPTGRRGTGTRSDDFAHNVVLWLWVPDLRLRLSGTTAGCEAATPPAASHTPSNAYTRCAASAPAPWQHLRAR